MKLFNLLILGVFAMTTNTKISIANTVQEKFPVGSQRSYSGNNLKNVSNMHGL